MKIAILGRTHILLNTIDPLISAGHQIVLIGTCKAEKEYAASENHFAQKANQLGVPYFCDHHINNYIELFKSVHADIAISMNWLTIIGHRVLDCFPYGILNAHSGDLPRYRGNACPNWAILMGEQKIGMCIHFMQPGVLDSGDILVKRIITLMPDTTITDVYQQIETQVPAMFLEAINKIEQNKPAEKQSTRRDDILRCYPRIPSDSFIDWNKSCKDIYNIVRASCAPFEGAYTFYLDKKIHIMKCRMDEFATPVCVVPGQVVGIDRENDEVSIAAGDGIIILEQIQIEKVPCSVTQVFKSMRIRLNYSVQDALFALSERILKLEEILATEGHSM